MSQFLSQNLTQDMRLEQKLTPQLIQSMAILQKPVADLEACINDALEGNAALEVADPAPSEGNGEAEASPDERGVHDRAGEDSFTRLDRFSRDRDLDFGDSRPPLTRRVPSSDERDPKIAAIANTPGREVGLHDYLLLQWSLLELEDELRRAGEAIIYQLDLDGYLRVPLQEVGASVKPPVELDVLERARQRIHQLDPIGVGARDMVECLLVQLEALPGDNTIERTLIENHLNDISRNRLPAVARATGYSIGEIKEAIKAMRSTLHLHPGYLVGDRAVPAIRPDVVVEYAETGGGLVVRLARGNTPELRIRDEVLAMAKSKANGKVTREFARKQVEAAAALIDAVTFRCSRLLEVSKAIIEQQREFFDVGPEGLKIFRM
ncbi:MAG: hypothetical protein KJ749_06630, partial [Planctomycetes bacterium]|nr:hypothetical protein [Planctomycetota bacterium]